MSDLIFYTNPQSRGRIVRWMLEEIGQPYDTEVIPYEEMKSELFICGVFSLLDKMMGEPFDSLLKSIPVPERVYQALAEEAGPYWPYLQLIRAVEAESLFDMREAAEQLLMGQAELNRSLLRALAGASRLE